MNAFENLVGKTFAGYREAGVANLFFIFPPMRAAGMHGSMPCYVPSGKAPYDVGGYYLGDGKKTSGAAIGAELKETRDHEHSLPLLGPDAKGNGVQYHQLTALVQLHKAGGMALLLWNNGGEIGVLDGPALALTLVSFDASLKSKNPTRGSRSIKWGMFKPVPLGLKDLPVWLPPAPACKKGEAA